LRRSSSECASRSTSTYRLKQLALLERIAFPRIEGAEGEQLHRGERSDLGIAHQASQQQRPSQRIEKRDCYC